jgi:hypothetical protein
MARARGIKPSFFRNADLMEFPFEARLLFIGLWTLADREGRLEDRPKQIKVDIFPGDDVDCNGLLDLLASTDMLIRYQVGGKRYLQVCNFTKHQNPHRDERASTLPTPYENHGDSGQDNGQHNASTVQAPCENGANTVAIGLTPDSLTPDSLTPDSLTNTHTLSFARGPSATELAESDAIGTQRQRVCVIFENLGMGPVSPSHPDLVSLLGNGVDVAMFEAAAKIAVAKKRPTFAYAVGVLRKQITDAMSAENAGVKVPAPPCFDVSRVTVPAAHDVDPALEKLNHDAKNFTPITAEIRHQIATLTGKRRGHANA